MLRMNHLLLFHALQVLLSPLRSSRCSRHRPADTLSRSLLWRQSSSYLSEQKENGNAVRGRRMKPNGFVNLHFSGSTQTTWRHILRVVMRIFVTFSVRAGQQDREQHESHREMQRPSPHLLPARETNVCKCRRCSTESHPLKNHFKMPKKCFKVPVCSLVDNMCAQVCDIQERPRGSIQIHTYC